MTRKLKHLPVFLYFLGWVGYFAYFWSHALYFDVQGNLVAGEVNIWGDWAAHLTMTTALAARGPLLANSPFLFGQPFSYPFAINAISALLTKIMPLTWAMIVPSFLLSILLIWALYYFYNSVFSSRIIAIVASLIFMLNGGTGFTYFIGDVVASPNTLQAIIDPPREYTDMEPEYIRWIAVINSMVVPQRAFVFGFPLGLLALSWLYTQVYTKKEITLQYTKLLGIGLLLGLLPLIHTHTFLNIFIILAIWSVAKMTMLLFSFYNPRRSFNQATLSFISLTEVKNFVYALTLVAVMTAVLAIPIFKLFFSHNVDATFLQWYPGWYVTQAAKDNQTLNWFAFWFTNWGVVPIMALLGMLMLLSKVTTKKIAAYFLPFFVIFCMANLFLFQPFVWDNTKLIVWSAVGFAGLSGYLLVHLWNSSRFILLRPFIFFIFLFTVASGGIDTYRMIRFNIHTYTMYTAEEVALADWVKANTDPNSLWLTSDQHNHWLFGLTGRQSLMTYRGWLWTHGYKYQTIERDVSRMLQYPGQNRHTFDSYGVDYVVVGPGELSVWHANPIDLDSQFDVAHQTEHYTIYRVNS